MAAFSILFLILPILWVLKISIYDPCMDHKLFKLYNLRSRTSFAAMRGSIDENSEDYKLLMCLINAEILLQKEQRMFFDIIEYLNSMIDCYTEETTFKSKAESLINNDVLAPYLNELMESRDKSFNRRLLIFKFSVFLIYIIACIFEIIFKHTNRESKRYKNVKMNEYEQARKQYNSISSSFA